jgi:hypothetical protein
VFSRPEKPIPRLGDREICLCPQAHHVRDASELPPPGTLFHLAVDQARRHLPLAPSTTSCQPLANMGREGREIHVETIAGEERQITRSQELS